MTRDDIIRMAREAGFRAGHIELYSCGPLPFIAPISATDCMPELERFAALVAATQREECAALCDRFALRDMHPAECAAAIRARGDA